MTETKQVDVWAQIRECNPNVTKGDVATALALFCHVWQEMPWLSHQCILRGACMFVHTIRQVSVRAKHVLIDALQCLNLQYKVRVDPPMSTGPTRSAQCTDCVDRPVEWQGHGHLNASQRIAELFSTVLLFDGQRSDPRKWQTFVDLVSEREVALLRIWDWNVYLPFAGMYEWADAHGHDLLVADRVVVELLLPSASMVTALRAPPGAAVDVSWVDDMVVRLAMLPHDQYALHQLLVPPQTQDPRDKRKAAEHDDELAEPTAKRRKLDAVIAT